MLTLEFTIEPFVPGQPGPHVLQAVAAAEALGVQIDFGPFGSSCTVPTERAHEVAGVVIAAAFANGATHISLTAARVDESDGFDEPGRVDQGTS